MFSLSVAVKEEVVTPSGTQQTPESDTPVLATAEPLDPLFYPSWYKAQPRQPSSPSGTPASGLGTAAPPAALQTSAKRAEAPAAAEESAVGSGKEGKASATPKVSASKATARERVAAFPSAC